MRDPVRWAFLGAGRIATNVMSGSVRTSSNAVLYAAAAHDPARARALEPHVVHASYDALLRDERVEAVYISLPNNLHVPWTLRALDAGKHVLCEKPLALSVEQLDEAVARADQRRRLLVEASMYRWHPRIRRLEELLAAGAVGNVRRVDVGFAFEGVAPGDYRLDAECGGGALYDVGCYGISAALLAYTWQQPVALSARATCVGQVDLTTDVHLTFASGEGEIHASMSDDARQWLRIEGDAGVAELSPPVFTAWWANETEIVVSGERVAVAAVDPYRLMVEAVSSRVRGGDAWLVPVEQSRAVAAVIDRVRQLSGSAASEEERAAGKS